MLFFSSFNSNKTSVSDCTNRIDCSAQNDFPSVATTSISDCNNAIDCPAQNDFPTQFTRRKKKLDFSAQKKGD